MAKIKPGSRKKLEIYKKQALKKNNRKKFVRIDFRLWKSKNKVPASLKMYETRYIPPFNDY